MVTWVGVASEAVIGINPHHKMTEPLGIRFIQNQFTFVIDELKGQNFSGYKFSKAGFKDAFIGEFRVDMRSGVRSDSDGASVFEMVGDDTMDACYTHKPSFCLIAVYHWPSDRCRGRVAHNRKRVKYFSGL